MRRWLTTAELAAAEDETRSCAQIHTGIVIPTERRAPPTAVVSDWSHRHYRQEPWVPDMDPPEEGTE